jgi:ketosteroid isomerase-like protein
MNTRAEIEALTSTFAQAITEKNFAALGRFYEEHARYLPPNGPMVEGPAAIEAAERRMAERGIVALDLEAVDVIEMGDCAVEIGRVTVTVQPPGLIGILLTLIGKRRFVKHGKSVVVWRRQDDGSLKIVVDTFNSD